MFPQKLATRLRDRLVQSRFLTISVTLHAILVLFLAMVVVIKPLAPPEGEFTPDGPLLGDTAEVAAPPNVANPFLPMNDYVPQPQPDSSRNLSGDFVRPITGDLTKPLYSIQIGGGASSGVPTPRDIPSVAKQGISSSELTNTQLKEIRVFNDRRPGDRSSKADYEFTAYIGRYKGNWNSTVRLNDGKITAGSLPNLLYVTSKWSKDRIKTNERNVQAIPLDSDEIFVTRPPFIFLTGTRDFKLTDKEIENLQKYIRLGGAIWGDSSVPGQRSAFDIAFEREMKRVLGENNSFEALPENHPVLAKGYFPKVKTLPSGINHYQEAVRVMRWGGEIAIIQTRNDYGDMWQIGLDKDGKIDLSRNENGQFVAMNESLWSNRGTYIRNVEQPAVEQAYKFGINMIFHLITRWESRTANSAPL